MNWSCLFQTQHAQAFKVASAAPGEVVDAIYLALSSALKTGGDFCEFQKRLSKELSPSLMPQD